MQEIKSYNSSTGRVTFKAPDNSFHQFHTQERYTFLSKTIASLDSEGEWYLDKDTSTLYYEPREGEIMNKTEIIAFPKLETIIDINGTDENKTENITFDGIQFLHSNWLARTVTDTVACKVGSAIKVKAAKTTVPYAEAHAMTHQNQWYSLDTQRISAL